MDSEYELEAFFAEQDERMTVSEADLRDFVARKASPIERVVPRQQVSPLHLNKISEGLSEISPVLSNDSRQDATKKRHIEPTPTMSTSTSRPHGTDTDATVPSLNAAGARSKRVGENVLAGPSRVKKQRKTIEDRERTSDVEAKPKKSTDRIIIQEPKVAPKKMSPLNETESIEPDPKSSRVVKKKETAAKQGDRVKTGSARTQKPLAVEVPVAGSRYAQVLAKSGSSFLQDEIATRIAKLGQSSKPQPRVLKAAKRETLEGIDASVSSASSAVSSRVSSPDLQISGKESSKSRPIAVKKSTASLTKKKNAQSDRMTPEKYALRILEQRRLEQENPPVKPKKAVPQFLRGKNIYYCGGEYENASDRTKKRLLLLDEFGANLQPKFDPECTTQIVVDGNVSLATLASKMGYKSWKQIPESIPTLTWDWLTTSMDSANSAKDPEKVIKLPEYWQNPAYHERFDAGSTVTKREASTSKGKQSDGLSSASLRPRMSFKVNHDANDADADSDREENNAPSASTGQDQALGEVGNNGPKLDADDPLAEFYAQAAAEHHERLQASFQSDVDDIGTDESDTDDEVEEAASVPKKPTGRRGFACDITDFRPKTCVNQDIVDKLSELAELHKAKPGEDNKWRAFTYSKAIRFLKSHDKPIKSYAQAVAIRGIGKKTAEKIQEIINTGELRRIGYENTDDVKVTRMFQGIYGVGQKIALTWYANGCRTLDDLKLGKCGVKLSEAQRIGLEHYDDINDRMPRTEAKALFDLIKPIALNIDPKLFVEIMGSYRRGKSDCGDIDILITRCPDDGKTHAGILATLLQKLHDVGILTEDLALPENPWDLEGIYRGLCRLPNVVESRHRRIDFLTVPWTSRGAALLYYTGDDIFNRAMRLKANHRGYSLNQKGLFEGVVRDPRNRTIKLNTGTLLASETEEEIFRILEVPYQEPHQRVRNFS